MVQWSSQFDLIRCGTGIWASERQIQADEEHRCNTDVQCFVPHSFIQEHEDDGGQSEDDDVCCDDVTTDAVARQCVRFLVYTPQCLSCAVTNYIFVKAFEN